MKLDYPMKIHVIKMIDFSKNISHAGFLLVLLLLVQSCDTNAQRNSETNTMESTENGECDGLLRLDAIVYDSYQKNSMAYVSKVDTFIYEQDSILKKTISYDSYNNSDGKFDGRIEVRYNEEVDPVQLFLPTDDPRYSTWSRGSGKIVVFNEGENEKEKYDYQYNDKTEEWHLIEHSVDSIDYRGLLVLKSKYSDRFMGRNPYVESKETYIYEDTVLIKKESVYRREGEGPEWEFSSCQIWSYQNSKLVEDVKYTSRFGEKYLLERVQFEYDDDKKTRFFEEFTFEGKLKKKNKTEEEVDETGAIVKSSFFSWDMENNEFVLTSSKEFKRSSRNEEVKTISLSDSVEKIMIREWDSLSRETRVYFKNREIGEEEWKLDDDFRYYYYKDEVRSWYRAMYDEKGEIERIDSLYVDSMGNPKKRIAKTKSFSVVDAFTHDTSLDSKCVLYPLGTALFEVDFFDSIFKHVNVPVRKEEYWDNKQGRNIIGGERYIYSPIK